MPAVREAAHNAGMRVEDFHKPLVPATYVVMSLDLAAERGVARDVILRDIVLPEPLLAHSEARVSLLTYGRIVARSLRLTGDAALGFAFGLRSSLTAHGLLGLGLMSQATLRDALTFGAQYFVPLRFPGFELGIRPLRHEGGERWIGLQETLPYGPLRQYAFDVLAVGFTHVLELALGRDEYTLCLQRPEPADFARFAGQLPTIRFDSEVNRIRVPAEALERPLPAANAMTAQLVRQQCDHDLALLGFRGDEPARVRALLYDSGSEGYPGVEQAAARLFMSVRTLKRRLHQHGLSYRVLVQEARFRKSQRMLRNTDLSVGEIATRLGYRSPANFTRAFRNWAGVSPGAYRKGDGAD